MTQPQQWTGVGRTETGHVRASNQDALAILDDSGVWIVADGMGGGSRQEMSRPTLPWPWPPSGRKNERLGSASTQARLQNSWQISSYAPINDSMTSCWRNRP